MDFLKASFSFLQEYARLVADYQLPLTAADEIYTRAIKDRMVGLDARCHGGRTPTVFLRFCVARCRAIFLTPWIARCGCCCRRWDVASMDHWSMPC